MASATTRVSASGAGVAVATGRRYPFDVLVDRGAAVLRRRDSRVYGGDQEEAAENQGKKSFHASDYVPSHSSLTHPPRTGTTDPRLAVSLEPRSTYIGTG
jgi:hypothetical protein